ncbi:MAG: glycogen/starch synthase [Bacteroidaceae bacterium]|nr:glycogen/starch synthase [Bacteroidaceae bacterium]
MQKETVIPDYIFQISWEVCHKVGGIYTVLSTAAQTLQRQHPDHTLYIGPDLWKGSDHPLFKEDSALAATWNEVTTALPFGVRAGRWQIPGEPICFLVDFAPLMERRNDVYAAMWRDFGVDSLQAYGDYHEACMFSLAAAMLAEAIVGSPRGEGKQFVFQAHEWMSGCGLLYVRKHCPEVGTIFTTHATSIGRSITTNDKPLYDYFEGYQGDQMARELHMEAKHSIEKQAALHAHCMTTVSEATDRECAQFLGRRSDIILMNGFEEAFVPKDTDFRKKRRLAREIMVSMANALMGTQLKERKTLIVSTSGRNDFRCKGFDVLLSGLSRLENEGMLSQDVLAVIAVPCWKKGVREDLKHRMEEGIEPYYSPLPHPYITHELHNLDEDRIVATMRACHLTNDGKSRLHVMLIPSYLDRADGLLNLDYYDWLTGSDLCLYPSYYEPWGYTCLESIAFGIPCLTTQLSGFGQWVNQSVGHPSTLADGVAVVERTDSSYEQTAQAIAQTIRDFMTLSSEEKRKIRRKAKRLSKQALWKHFIKNYYTAFALSLSKRKP